MTEIICKDIKTKKVFHRIGCTYYQVYADNDNHIYVYDIIRDEDGEHRGYEIVKGKRKKNPDGSIVYTYPCDEDFGRIAWCTMGTENTFDREMENIIAKVEILQNRENG